MDATTGSRRPGFGAVARRARTVGSIALAAVGVVSLVAALGLRGGDAAARGPGGSAAPLAALGATVNVPSAFQMVPGDQPSVAVLGTGEASAPAESGTLQLILRAVDPFAAQAAGSEGQASPPSPPGQPPALTEEQVQPVADAIVAAGVAEGVVEVIISQGPGGPFGPGAAQVLVELDRADLDLAQNLVTAGSEAAGQTGLFVESVGAGYEVADCDRLVREARRAAAEDARSRAQGVAEVLGLRLGDVVLASETPYYGGEAGSGCTPPTFGPAGKGTYFPPFDPSAEPEVEVYAQLNLAYAIA